MPLDYRLETADQDAGGRVVGRSSTLEQALKEVTRRSDILIRIGEEIGSGRDVAGIVQTVVEGGLELTGARFGAFVYDAVAPGRDSYILYTRAGASRPAFERFPAHCELPLFASIVAGGGVIRCDDIRRDRRHRETAARCVLPDGMAPIRSYLAVPVVSRAGEVLGGLFFGHDQPGVFGTDHERMLRGLAGQAAAAIEAIRANEAALNALEARRLTEANLGEDLSFALNAGRMGSWKFDVATRAYEASDLCKANYGRRLDESFGIDDLVASIHPEDRPRMVAAMEKAINDGTDYDIEYRVIWPNSEERWVHVRGRAEAIVPGGMAKRMAGVSLDITERRRGEERQRLLLNELNHRVKNTLATVQSIAYQTLRTARSPGEFRDAFEARLLALSETHNLLTLENWEGAPLRAVLDAELEAYGGPGRALIEPGPDIQLNPKAAVAIGMAFHELATNAAKYGALSTPRGLVTVRWRTVGGALQLDWEESGGPLVDPPTRRGFGSRLLEKGLAAELGGRVELAFGTGGVTCSMHLPIPALEGKG